MPILPDHPDLDHLKKQAKALLVAYRRGDAEAFDRFRSSLPAVAGRDDPAIAALGLRLHDAQSCLAREYGFQSFAELAAFVGAQRAATADRATVVAEWLRLVYPADIGGGRSRASPTAAARLLDARPDLTGGDASLACAVGDVAAIRSAAERDPAWVDRPGGPLALPPLVAVAHSAFVRHPDYHPQMVSAARLLIDLGADPNQFVWSRWPPASVEQPSTETRLSALYGAAGQACDPELTKILLNAGADPNDNESLYHSLERPEVTRLLLEAGARIGGSNANYRVFDLDNLESLRLLIEHGKREQPPLDWSRPLLFAIRRGRGAAHVEALLDAGAQPTVRSRDGASAHGLALRYGLTDVAELLRKAAGSETLSEDERFVAACSAADEAGARRIQSGRPDLPSSFSPERLRMLPEMAANGRDAAVRVMVRLGWPIETKGGDWDASALNLAVFRGDAQLTRFLLAHGADWRARHGMGDNVCGTLSWASSNEEGGDWVACAEALLAHGMPKGEPGDVEGVVVVEGQPRRFPEEVASVLAGSSTDPARTDHPG